MAKKKEIKKEIETKEEQRLTLNDIKEICIKYIKKNKETIVRAIVSAAVLILVVIVGYAAVSAIKEKSLDNIDYPLVYQKEDGQLLVMTSKDKTKKDAFVLSEADGTGYTTYQNRSKRYILTKKENDLYLYDTKKKEKPFKITDDVSVYGFSEKDSYVYLVDVDNDLYSYNFKDAKKLLDASITIVQDVSDKGLIYKKIGKLYYTSFNPDKGDRTELVNDYEIAEFSEDGKNVLYTNSNNALYRYNVKKQTHTKIGSDVESFYCDDSSCEKLYYTSIGKTFSLNYHDGKKSEEIEKEIYSIEAINVDKKMVLYSLVKNGKIELHYKKGKSKSVKVTDNYTMASSLKMLENELYFVNSEGNLMYAKINDKKIGKLKEISEEVQSTLKDCKDGIYFYKNMDDEDNATFYVAKSGKVTKIADDVKETKITVSNNGKKIYYIKNVEDNSGDLYVFDGKKSKEISKDVYRFLYIRDDMVYYLKKYDVDKRSGDLYRYNGKNTKIEENVSGLSSTPNAYIAK